MSVPERILSRVGKAWLRVRAASPAKREETLRSLHLYLDAGIPIEDAVGILASTADDLGERATASMLTAWREALLTGRFPEEIRSWMPSTEAMIFDLYGEVEPADIFQAATRITELRIRMVRAMQEALATPALLAVLIMGMIWAASWQLFPILAKISPPEGWNPAARAFLAVGEALQAHPLAALAALIAALAALRLALTHWTGPGRAAADRLPPFNLYRILTGAGFIAVALAYLRLRSADLNDQSFARLQGSTSPYVRDRIERIRQQMRAGRLFGAAMLRAGTGFPDPAIVRAAAALDGLRDAHKSLDVIVGNWGEDAEKTMRKRAALLRAVLMVLAGAVLGALILSVMSVAFLATRSIPANL